MGINHKNSFVSYTGLIEKYVGTAFDVVLSVHNNIDNIEKVVVVIDDGSLANVADNIEEIANVSEKLDAFTEIYLGAFTTEPLTDNEGAPIKTGALYYNIEFTQLYIYDGSNWSPAGSVDNSVDVVRITTAMHAGSSTVVNAPTPYNVGSNAIAVYVNSVYQISRSVDNLGAYDEIDANTISFPNVLLEEEDVVTLIVGTQVTTVNPIISINKLYYTTLIANEQVITLPSSNEYVVGANNLNVYTEGLLQSTVTDYTETSPTTITFTVPLPNAGTSVTFVKGNLVGNVPAAGSTVLIFNTAADIFINRGSIDTSKVLYTKGFSTIGDDGGGLFVYNNTTPQSSANAGTIIDMDALITQQGINNFFGCWVRQYSGDIKPEWFGQPATDISVLKFLFPKVGDTFSSTGFYPSSPESASRYYWDTTALESSHNGGSIISPEVLTPPGSALWWTPTVTGNDGCWIRLDTFPANVLHFGAKADGATDDSSAFIAAAASGVVEVPVDFSYKVSGTIVGSFFSYGPTIILVGNVSTIKDLLI